MLEAIVSLAAGIVAGSVVRLGFGIDRIRRLSHEVLSSSKTMAALTQRLDEIRRAFD